jgi:hypothetical protein
VALVLDCAFPYGRQGVSDASSVHIFFSDTDLA